MEQSTASRHFCAIFMNVQEEAEAVLVQPQFPVLIDSHNRRDFVHGVAAFLLNALFVN